MAKFRDIKNATELVVVRPSILSRFHHDCYLNRRDIFKQSRAATIAEWHQLAV